MKFLKILGKGSKYVGKSVLRDQGLLPPKDPYTPEFWTGLRRVIAEGVEEGVYNAHIRVVEESEVDDTTPPPSQSQQLMDLQHRIEKEIVNLEKERG